MARKLSACIAPLIILMVGSLHLAHAGKGSPNSGTPLTTALYNLVFDEQNATAFYLMMAPCIIQI